MLNLIELWKRTQLASAQTSTAASQAVVAGQAQTTAQILAKVSAAATELAAVYPVGTKPAAIAFDANTTQASFEFAKSPNVVFVRDIRTLKPANFYSKLPVIKLTAEEEAIRIEVVKEQKAKNLKFYDGMQMVITGVAYDEASNCLYMEARQVPYSFIVALSSSRFPKGSALYQGSYFKTGVLAPLISRDDQTVLFQRTADTLFSVPAGFLEAFGPKKRLNSANKRPDLINLVTCTAHKEIEEEIAGIKGSKRLRFEYSFPEITSISFRQTNSLPISTVEFVAPSYTNCKASDLVAVINNPSAKDAHEHTKAHVVAPLTFSTEGDTYLRALLANSSKIPGVSLYVPVILSAMGLINRDVLKPVHGGVSVVKSSLGMFAPQAKVPKVLHQSGLDDLMYLLLSSNAGFEFYKCLSDSASKKRTMPSGMVIEEIPAAEEGSPALSLG